MGTLLNDAILKIADALLGWLLRLPPDVALLLIAVGTAAVMVLARLFTTDQDLLRRCDQDKRRLKQLIREARARKDKAAVQRHRATIGRIGLKTMRAEGLPLLAAIVPVAVLGTWCFQRLAWVAPEAGQPVAVVAYFPVSAAGQLVHMVPQDGLAAEDGWIQEIVADTAPGSAEAKAAWRLTGQSRPEPYTLEIRYKRAGYTKELRIGQRVYAPPVESYGDGKPLARVETELRPVDFFGLVPRIPWLDLPQWLVAYLLIAFPSVSLLKRVMSIH
ncbi:MAG: hypothetical protein ABR915_00845 [Thermoguttaceae bacterium]|jgi:uncharacterized membrane protein (DUF106 family)